MTGTVKQIAYATDIINKAVARVNEVIASGTNKIERRETAIRAKIHNYVCPDRKIIEAWIESKSYLESILTIAETAGQVIDVENEIGWFSYAEEMVCQKCGRSAIS